jgi:hypothetical protein
MRIASYDTTSPRVALSLIAGALAGASLIALWWVWGTAQNLGVQYLLNYGALPTVFVFIVALVIWAIGLATFGLPLWWLLHKLGLRHWLVAVVAGAALTFLVDFGIETRLFELIPPLISSNFSASDSGGPTIIANQLTSHGWRVTFLAALQLSLGGALVALVIWRIAYRSAKRQALS